MGDLPIIIRALPPYSIAIVGQGELVRDLLSYAFGRQHELVTLSDARELVELLGQGRRYAAIVLDSSVLAGSAAEPTLDVLREHAARLIFVTDDPSDPVDMPRPLPEARIVRTSEVARLQAVVDDLLRS